MQIIQSIRDKGAAIVITVIALSLIGFILMDARQGSNRLFGSMSDNVGKVNGETIDAAYFSKRVKEAEDMQAQRTGQRPSGAQAFQVMEQMWNQIVAEKIFFAEAEKLGIAFTGAELSHILQSDDPSNPLLQEPGMKDSATGKLDRKKAGCDAEYQEIKGEQREVINSQVIEPLKLNTMVSRYSGLLSAGAYYPKWMQEKDASESGNFANISYVNIPYTEISDSTVKVSDEEVIEYVKKNKELFKQEAGRNISYVTFSQLPGAEDSARTSAEIAALKPLFEADSNAKVFVSRNASTVEFTDEFVPNLKFSLQQ
jgi:peptidyl-prolyl cis-trans isomerase D